MAYSIKGRCRYRRNLLPAVALRGERVIDVCTGIPKYQIDCVPYLGGYTTRKRGPDINPKTDAPDLSGS